MTDDPDMHLDTPSIASDPIYVGPPDTIELEDDVGEVRVWSDDEGEWIDSYWHRDGDELRFMVGANGRPKGTIRVVEMIPVADLERESIGEYPPEESGDGAD